MVVRDEPAGMRRYCHIGTGNYHHHTANLYEDAGLLTADESIGDEIAQFFNSLTGYGRGIEYDELLVAPRSLRSSLEELIAAEAAAPNQGRIVMKMNSLVDAQMIDRLYEASEMGVSIDLIVRGICCLRPGVQGLSENITVRSLVGRYLEHSRIFYFANGDGPGRPAYYLGSADLMNRNLSRRVEAAVRIGDDKVKSRIAELLEISLSDRYISWELSGDGTWSLVRERGGVDAHVRLQQLAVERKSDRADPEVVERWRRRGR